ncbi:MAG TPA: fumarylacetoacetate hydrolase family protein [Ramlibacter sp.]|nr:fumarylacetoacetate hydrolase family protein [Ramlibacter sp.]
MRLATFALKSQPQSPRVGVLRGERMFDVTPLIASWPGHPVSMKSLLAQGADALKKLGDRMQAQGSGASHAVEDIRFLPPITDASKFLCVGKNYRTHLEELKRTDLIKEMPQEPTAFVKLNDCLTGHDEDVVRPPTVTHLDYEPELVFVIGKPAYQVNGDDAMSYVAGLTILNDLTCRDTQKREVASGSRFWTAKNAPGFGPLGPCIITMDEVPDPYDIWVTCSVNGEQRMRVNTSDQIWKLPRIIEHFSRLVPLMPGDMFSTGAPGGVAVGKPNAEELFLKPGDVVECAFENPGMVLRNRIVSP